MNYYTKISFFFTLAASKIGKPLGLISVFPLSETERRRYICNKYILSRKRYNYHLQLSF